MRNGANHSKHHGCNVTCANLSHAYMRDQKCSGVRVLDTTRLRKMCVRRGVLSSHTVACTTFADVCTRNYLKKNCGITILDLSIGNLVGPQMGPAQTVSSCGLNLQTNHDVAILVISPLSALVSKPLRALMFVFMLPPILWK